MSLKKIDLHTTNRGYPALWERGGGLISGGSARIVAGSLGEKRRPVFVRTRRQLACEHHALITIDVLYHVIEVRRHRQDFAITVLQITRVDVRTHEDDRFSAEGEVETIAEFVHGEWNHEPPLHLLDAIDAGKQKASEYHCRRALYIK